LDEDVVTLIESDSYTARPVTVPGWDLSTIAAARVVEGAFHSYATTPSAAKVMLNAFPYRVAMDASFEWENDSFASGMDLFVLAFAFAFARGIGADLINGNGSTGPTGQPRGILTGAAVSGVSLDPTITNDVSNTLNDAFQDAYFSVNRAYRAMPKCGWVMSDTTYQWVRKLTDKNGRPLLNIKADKEELMGKPVFVSPSLPSYAASPSTVGKIIFGDLSHFVVRISQAQIGRYLQTANGSGADFGKELFVGRMRADCNVLDPTGGSTPAIVSIDVQP
jgi:HK97 family phage major capsid protein